MPGTISEIAKRAGTSRGTVDRVLHGRGRVRPELAKLVTEIAQEMGYVPGQPVRKPLESVMTDPGTVRKLGVMIQSSGVPGSQQFRAGADAVALGLRLRGFQVEVRECGRDDDAQVQTLLELERESVAGLAIMSACAGDRLRREVNRIAGRIPVAALNTDLPGSGRVCFVGPDYRKAGRTAAGLMEMLTGGTGEVLGIISSFTDSTSSERIEGFTEQLRFSRSEIRLAGVQSCSDRAEEVEQIVLSCLQVYPDLRGIYMTCGGEDGLRSALKKIPGSRKPFVILSDLTPGSRLLLQEGTAQFAVDQDCARQCATVLGMLANQVQLGGGLDNPLVWTDIRILTRENM